MRSFSSLSGSLHPKFLEGRIWVWFIFECCLVPGTLPCTLDWSQQFWNEWKEASLNGWVLLECIDWFSWQPCDLKGPFVQHCIVCKHFHIFIDTRRQVSISLFYCWGNWPLEKLWDSTQIFWFPALKEVEIKHPPSPKHAHTQIQSSAKIHPRGPCF